jgi:hypothetical protein
MKKKTKPREWWLAFAPTGQVFLCTKRAYARQLTWSGGDVVLVREVLPSLPKKKAKRT